MEAARAARNKRVPTEIRTPCKLSFSSNARESFITALKINSAINVDTAEMNASEIIDNGKKS
jgi:hypothetical protein